MLVSKMLRAWVKAKGCMNTNLTNTLDPMRRSKDASDFENAMRRKVVGQDQAIEKVVEIYQMFLAGLNPPGHPVAPCGQSVVPWTNGFGQNPCGGSHGTGSVRQYAILHQNRLRGISALS
jgi:hypothetical protein